MNTPRRFIVERCLDNGADDFFVVIDTVKPEGITHIFGQDYISKHSNIVTTFEDEYDADALAEDLNHAHLAKIIKDRPRPYNADMAAFLYALRDSGITNMAGAGKYIRAEGFWDYLELSPSEASDIVAYWSKEVEAGGMEADPTVTQELYDENVEDIETYRSELEEL